MALFCRWERSRWGTPMRRPARIELYALLLGPRIDGALERARTLVPDDAAWDALEIDVRARATDVGRLDEALSGRAALALESCDEHTRREVATCARYATIAATLPDPSSLEVLQAAHALLSALAREDDLLLAVDRSTARLWTPPELSALRDGRGFDLDEHVRVVVEAVERRPGAGHIVRSRGLVKFARPDVAARVPRRDSERVSEIVRDVARLLADGELLSPGDRVSLEGAPSLTLIPRRDDCQDDDAPDTAPLFELRDLGPAGRPGPSLAGLLAALRPKPRLGCLTEKGVPPLTES
ncbi:MAG: hypothetical protein EXR72_23730 [Myxococcales bacterium]|nr:hypothetical protein [Myxococcales bacterium]